MSRAKRAADDPVSRTGAKPPTPPDEVVVGDDARDTDEGDDEAPAKPGAVRSWQVRIDEVDQRIAALQAERRRLEHHHLAERLREVKHLRHYSRMIRACWRAGFADQAQTFVDQALPLLASYERPASGPDDVAPEVVLDALDRAEESTS